MKRTINEVYDLIVEKRDNALNDEKANENDRFYLREITGAINAYEDVLCLIDSSHLLEEDKPVKGSGLEALENIKLTCDNTRYSEEFSIYEECENDFDIVEKALKDYEKKTKLAKEYADVNNVAKRLKALEIIKKLLEEPIKNEGFPEYDEEDQSNIITKEEYDLLKEALL